MRSRNGRGHVYCFGGRRGVKAIEIIIAVNDGLCACLSHRESVGGDARRKGYGELNAVNNAGTGINTAHDKRFAVVLLVINDCMGIAVRRQYAVGIILPRQINGGLIDCQIGIQRQIVIIVAARNYGPYNIVGHASAMAMDINGSVAAWRSAQSELSGKAPS